MYCEYSICEHDINDYLQISQICFESLWQVFVFNSVFFCVWHHKFQPHRMISVYIECMMQKKTIFFPDDAFQNSMERLLRSQIVEFLSEAVTAFTWIKLSIYKLWCKRIHSLSPVTNSLKLMRESLFWSSRRKSRLDSVLVWRPQLQGARAEKSWMNRPQSMRYCSRYGRLWSCRSAAVLLAPQ